MFNLITNQKGSIEQKVSSLAHLAEICNNYASIYSHNNLDKKSKQILQLTADYILNNPHLNRSEKLKYTSKILAKSQSLFPDDKESRRAIITNMNRTLKTKIPLAQQNTQNLLQTLQSAQETSLNNQDNKIQMPFNNSKDIA